MVFCEKRGKTSVFGVGFNCQVLVSVSLSSLDCRSWFGSKTQNPVPVPVVNRDRFCHYVSTVVRAAVHTAMCGSVLCRVYGSAQGSSVCVAVWQCGM